MKLTIREIKEAHAQWTFDGGCTAWRKLCDLMPPKDSRITHNVAREINSQLSPSEIQELKEII